MRVKIKTFLLVLLLALPLLLLFGLMGIIEPKAQAAVGAQARPEAVRRNTEAKNSKELWLTQLRKYSEIYAAIKNNYPDQYDTQKLFFASISGLLKKLDPHSYFLDPLMVRSLNEDQQGNYHGIGTRITKYEDRLTVIAPLPGTPAERLGIMAGDVIAEIEGKDTVKISLDDAMKMLRGAEGTYVSIKIKRAGLKDLIPFKIKRAEIPLNSISYSLVLADHPDIGFISIRTFGNTTAGELAEDLERLIKEHHIKGLIIDLRGNSGGSLYAAVDVADFFLAKGNVIVSVKGRAFNQSFEAKQDGQFEGIPLVVLINRGSASASEIVAAAMQDHKRAKIIGSRSWGKGLVQTISSLSMKSSLALTTAKYYTPNNKCLQRDFGQLDDYYYFLNNRNYDSDTSIEGGVIPDISVSPGNYTETVVKFISHGTLFQFARRYVAENSSVTTTFTVDDEVINRFKAFLSEIKLDYDAEDFNKGEERLKLEITREIIAHKFSQDEGVKVFLKADAVTQKAVEVLKKENQ